MKVFVPVTLTVPLKPLFCRRVIVALPVAVRFVAVNASPAEPPDFVAPAMLAPLPSLTVSVVCVVNVPVAVKVETSTVFEPPVPVLTLCAAAPSVNTLPVPESTYVSITLSPVTVPAVVRVICSVPAAVTVPLKPLCCAAVMDTDAPLTSVRLVASSAPPAEPPVSVTPAMLPPSSILMISAATVLNVPVAVRPATLIVSAPSAPVVTF